MAEELDGLWEKGTSRKASPLRGIVPMKTRFVFKIKRVADGSIERYKSRLVAKGIHSTFRTWMFFETFSRDVWVRYYADRFSCVGIKEDGAWTALRFKQADLNAPPLREDIWLKLSDGEVS